jgi:hypothetical protein
MESEECISSFLNVKKQLKTCRKKWEADNKKIFRMRMLTLDETHECLSELDISLFYLKFNCFSEEGRNKMHLKKLRDETSL